MDVKVHVERELSCEIVAPCDLTAVFDHNTTLKKRSQRQGTKPMSGVTSVSLNP